MRGVTITAIAVCRTDWKGKQIAAYAEEVKEEGSLDDVMGKIRAYVLTPFTSRYVVISQHQRAYQAALGTSLFSGKPWLDIAQVSWPLGFSDLVAARDLDTLAKHFGIVYADSSSVSENCDAVTQVYWEMMKRYKLSLLGGEIVREYGGKRLKQFRDFFGV